MRLPPANNRLNTYLFWAASVTILFLTFDLFHGPTMAIILSFAGINLPLVGDWQKYGLPLFVAVYGLLICAVDDQRVRRAVREAQRAKPDPSTPWRTQRYLVPLVKPRVFIRTQTELPCVHPDLPENRLVAPLAEQVPRAAAIIERFEQSLIAAGNVPVVTLRVGRPLCPTPEEAGGERKGDWVSLAAVAHLPSDHPWLLSQHAFVWVQAATGIDDNSVHWTLFSSCWNGFAQGWRAPSERDRSMDSVGATIKILTDSVVRHLVRAIHEDAAAEHGEVAAR